MEMATIIVEEKSMTDEEYREEFYRLMAEIDAIRAGFKERTSESLNFAPNPSN
jgi:hypothetical protein